jgi:hypothetical protein
MRRVHVPRPAHATVVAYLALIVAMSGTAAAATGSAFVLGRDNTAGRTSSLTSRAGAPLELVGPAGKPPLWVSSSAKVPRLNASRLDGVPARHFARQLCHTSRDDDMIAQRYCTRIVTVSAPLTDTGYVSQTVQSAPGGAVRCPFGFAISGGYRLGDSATPDTVIESRGDDWRFQNTAWLVRLQPNPANGGHVAPGGEVYVTCIGGPDD